MTLSDTSPSSGDGSAEGSTGAVSRQGGQVREVSLKGDWGAQLPQVSVPPPGPGSRDLLARLRRVESRNVTFVGAGSPVVWSEARGANVRDVDGNVYVDLTGAFGVAITGHGDPVIASALQEQMTLLIHGMGDVHPTEIRVTLLERLTSLGPWPHARAVMASSGSEAVEIALKTAQLATGRPGVLAFKGGYHGLTLGALAVTARPGFREPFRPRVYEDVEFLPFPGPTEDPEPVLRAAGRVLAGTTPGGAAVGAVVVEPIQGRGGVNVPPPGFLEGLAKITRESDAVLIFDEVFTGFGRTGDLFAWQRDGVAPDVMVVGKALGGGLPVSACMGSAKVMDAWPESSGEALHTSTFLGHPLSCASALAFLDRAEDLQLPALCHRKGERLRVVLSRELEGVPTAGGIRGRGLMLGIPVLDRGTGETLPDGGARVAERALARGVLVLPAGDRGEVVEITPPAVLTDEQMDASATVLGECFREIP